MLLCFLVSNLVVLFSGLFVWFFGLVVCCSGFFGVRCFGVFVFLLFVGCFGLCFVS